MNAGMEDDMDNDMVDDVACTDDVDNNVAADIAQLLMGPF